MQFRLNCTILLAAILLCSCSGGSSTGQPDTDDGKQPVVNEPQLADPSEVANPGPVVDTGTAIWPGPGGGAANSSRTNLMLPDSQPAIRSVTSISDRTSSTAAVGADGSIVVGCGKLLMKYTAEGQLLWQRSLLLQHNARPFIDDNGQILLASGDPPWQTSKQRANWVMALGPDGNERWRFDTTGYSAIIYAMAADGAVLVRSDQSQWSMLSSAGQLLWQRDLDADVLYNAALDSSGRVYTGSERDALLCLEQGGETAWSFTPEGVDPARLTTNTRLQHPEGSIVLLSGREAEPESFNVSVVSAAGKLLASWPCGEQFSIIAVDDSGNLLLTDRQSRVSTFSLQGELLDSDDPGYGFPFGINTSLPQRFYSVLARPDDFSEYLLTSADEAGNELWRLSSRWSFRYPVLDDQGMLYSGDERSFFALDRQGRRHWQQIHGAALSELAVAGNGRIYSCGGRNLYAFGEDASLLWQISAEGEITAAPALLPGGRLAFGDSEGFFYIYENNGTRHSKYILEGAIVSSPAVAADGSLFVGTADGELYSFSAALEPLRQFSADSGIRVSPAIDADGTAYVATDDGHIHAVYVDGIEAWERNLSEPVNGPLLVGDEYRVFGATASGRVFALHGFDGNLVWDHYLGQEVADGLALDNEAGLLVATHSSAGSREEPVLERNGSGRGLYRFTADGTPDWSLNGAYAFSGQPLVDGQGRICFEAAGWLLCVDASGNELWRLQCGHEDDLSSAVALGDGRLAVSSGTQLLVIE